MDTVNTGLSPEDSALLEAALVEAHESDNSTLKPNSPSLLIDESTSRFSSASWFEEMSKQSVLLAGLGGIGSWTAFLLSRTNVRRLLLYDNDAVDSANMSGQLYGRYDVGSYKTHIISSFIREYSDHHNILAYDCLYAETSNTENIMIGGFDNMHARKVFFRRWVHHVVNLSEEERENCLFIDARLAAEEFQVFCIKGTDDFLIKKYDMDWLFDDSEAEETPCSYKQTSFCASMVASTIVNLFVNFIANKCNPLIERELPFYTSYDATRMILKTETV